MLGERHDALAVKPELAEFKGAADLRHQLQFAVLVRHVPVPRPMHLDAVAPLVLGVIAASIGKAQYLVAIAAFRGNQHQPDADAHAERLVLPHETKLAHRLAHGVGDAHRLIRRARFEQRAEFVAAEPRQRVAAAHAREHDHRELAQQLVARAVPAGVVDRLEVVEVHEHQRVLTALGPGGFDQFGEPALELAPVNEPGQRIVTRLPDQLLRHGPGLADIVKYDDHAQRSAVAAADRGMRIADRAFASVAVDEAHRNRVNLVLGAVACDLRQRLNGRSAALVDYAVDLEERPATRVAGGPPRIPLGNRVQVLDASVGVSGNHAVADRVQRNLRQLFFKLERALGMHHPARDQHRDETARDQPQYAQAGGQQQSGACRHARLNHFLHGRNRDPQHRHDQHQPQQRAEADRQHMA